MALGDTRREPCKFCQGPAGECAELRGGFLPDLTCKKKPTYDELWQELKEVRAQLESVRRVLRKRPSQVMELEYD